MTEWGSVGRALAASTINGVVITDHDRLIVWVNAAFESATGYTLKEVRGCSPGAVLQCAETEPHAIAQLRDALGQARPVRVELTNRRKNGELMVLDLEILPIHDQAGNVVQFLGIQEDITAKRRTHTALERASALERQASSRLALMAGEQDAMLSSLSHELRTPLHGMLSALRIVRDEFPQSHSKTLVERAISSGEVLGRMLDGVTMPTPAPSKDPEHRQSCDVSTLFDEVVGVCRMAAHRDTQIVSSADDLTQRRWVNDALLRRLLLHVCSTATRELTSGRIMLRMWGTEEGIRFSMLCTLPVAWDRHHEQLAALAGDVDATLQLHEDGRGLRLFVPAAEHHDAELHASSLPAGSANTDCLPVLVVDDNDLNRLVARRLIESRGHPVVTASSGAEAMRRIEHQAFSMILMDVNMPDWDGLSTTRRIREWEKTHGSHRLPIVALTASTSPDSQRQCRDAGMDGFLTKPLRLGALEMTLQGHFEGQIADADPQTASTPKTSS